MQVRCIHPSYLIDIMLVPFTIHVFIDPLLTVYHIIPIVLIIWYTCMTFCVGPFQLNLVDFLIISEQNQARMQHLSAGGEGILYYANCES